MLAAQMIAKVRVLLGVDLALKTIFNNSTVAKLSDYIKNSNEAFAVSHREHASIVGIAKSLSHFPGFRFVKEVENLGRILDAPQKPVVLVIGGIKRDKVEYDFKSTKSYQII